MHLIHAPPLVVEISCRQFDFLEPLILKWLRGHCYLTSAFHDWHKAHPFLRVLKIQQIWNQFSLWQQIFQIKNTKMMGQGGKKTRWFACLHFPVFWHMQIKLHSKEENMIMHAKHFNKFSKDFFFSNWCDRSSGHHYYHLN